MILFKILAYQFFYINNKHNNKSPILLHNINTFNSLLYFNTNHKEFKLLLII